MLALKSREKVPKFLLLSLKIPSNELVTATNNVSTGTLNPTWQSVLKMLLCALETKWNLQWFVDGKMIKVMKPMYHWSTVVTGLLC